MKISVYPTAVLARSPCLLVAAPIENSTLPVDERVSRAVAKALEDPASLKAGKLDDYTLARTLAALYGGLILFYTCRGLTRLSRASVEEGITIRRLDYQRTCPTLDDHRVLDAWSLILSGDVAQGLRYLAGCMPSPPGHYWHVGGASRISPIGINL